jgi:hypothetical protein
MLEVKPLSDYLIKDEPFYLPVADNCHSFFEMFEIPAFGLID